MNLSLITIQHPNAALLRQACEPVTVFDDELRERAARLVEIMHEPGAAALGRVGIGLAANQAGWMQRVFTAYIEAEMIGPAVYVNPRIVWWHPKSSGEPEQCLSCPRASVKVRRPNAVTMEYQDLWGQRCSETCSSMLARVWQHEIDHLNGVLILDKGGF